ncbi:MAG: 2-oxoacid:acceptor oxidoreductase family protein [Candidatus Aenigmarchaeota archaeon]|nr:2-oxoacid:acceptor oxidoreductase family protein [Candidatus Aenigmarchaeota archaeon]
MLFHFRGHSEQGVRTAARLFGMASVLSGQRANAWVPDHAYGIGDGVSAFVKVEREEFFERGPAEPEDADFTVIFEPSFLDPKTLREGSALIINTTEKPRNPQLKKRKIRIFAVDASEHVFGGKRVFPNLFLLGFLSSVFKKVQLKALKQAVVEEFSPAEEKMQELDAGFKMKPKIR